MGVYSLYYVEPFAPRVRHSPGSPHPAPQRAAFLGAAAVHTPPERSQTHGNCVPLDPPAGAALPRLSGRASAAQVPFPKTGQAETRPRARPPGHEPHSRGSESLQTAAGRPASRAGPHMGKGLYVPRSVKLLIHSYGRYRFQERGARAVGRRSETGTDRSLYCTELSRSPI